jgi:hypothetical protein
MGAHAEKRRQRKLERRLRLLESGPTPIEPLTDDEMQDIEDEERGR